MSIEKRGLINGLIAAIVSLLVVFGLAAVLGPPSGLLPAPSSTSSSAPSASPGSSGSGVKETSIIVEGRGFFMQSCARCHGNAGQGVDGPDIRNEGMTDAEIAATVANGIKPGMPSFKSKLTPDQITAVVAYVRTLKK